MADKIQKYTDSQIAIFALNLNLQRIKKHLSSRKKEIVNFDLNSKPAFIEKVLVEYLDDPKNYRIKKIIQQTPLYTAGTYKPLVSRLRDAI